MTGQWGGPPPYGQGPPGPYGGPPQGPYGGTPPQQGGYGGAPQQQQGYGEPPAQQGRKRALICACNYAYVAHNRNLILALTVLSKFNTAQVLRPLSPVKTCHVKNPKGCLLVAQGERQCPERLHQRRQVHAVPAEDALWLQGRGHHDADGRPERPGQVAHRQQHARAYAAPGRECAARGLTHLPLLR